MQTGKRIEQLILTRSGGTVAALVVTEAPSGARQRERWPALAAYPEEAIDRLAAQLGRRGDLDGVTTRLRVRLERGDTLVERSDLAGRFRDRLQAVLDEEDGFGA